MWRSGGVCLCLWVWFVASNAKSWDVGGGGLCLYLSLLAGIQLGNPGWKESGMPCCTCMELDGMNGTIWHAQFGLRMSWLGAFQWGVEGLVEEVLHAACRLPCFMLDM